MHGACIGRNAQVKRTHERRHLAQRKLAAQVGLCKPRALRHLLPQLHLVLATQKYGRKVGSCQPQCKARPESCIWAFGGLAGSKHQAYTARASGRRAGMPHTSKIGVGRKIKQVQVGPVKGIGAVVLGKGGAVKLPETLYVQARAVGHWPKLEGRLQLGHGLGCHRAAAQVYGRCIAVLGKNLAVGWRKEYGIGCQRHELLKKSWLGHHP